MARRLAREHDLTIDSAMISDVPGMAWGTVAALARRLSDPENHVIKELSNRRK